MSNLNNNTTQLEALLAAVNALPEAGGGTNTSDATATADEIFAGETAYTADGKVTGTFTIQEELTEQNELISQITNLVATKTTPSSGGTEDLDAELTTQESLISQLSTILDNKAGGSGGSNIISVTNSGNSSTSFKYIDINGQEASAAPGTTIQVLNKIIYVPTSGVVQFLSGTSFRAINLNYYVGYSITSESAEVYLSQQSGGAN